MDFRTPTTLGRTGLTVSRLGIAASYGVSAQAIQKAFHERGINLFYWGSRRTEAMGQALRNLARQDRDRMVIAFQTYDRTGLFLRSRHEKGLRSLGIDSADILIMGWSNSPPGGRWLEAALLLREEGKVRFLCVSGHRRKTLGDLAARSDLPFDLVMVRYSAAHRGAEQDVFPRIPDRSPPGIMTYTATRWGQLLDPRKMPPGEEPLTAADCYRFALSNPHVDLCMTGPRTAGELEEGLRALDLGPLSDEEMQRVTRIGDWVRGK